MSAARSPDDQLARASAVLQHNQPPQLALDALQGIARGQPQFAEAQYLRGICAIRLGQGLQAKDLLIDAARLGQRQNNVWVALAYAAVGCGIPDDILGELLGALEALQDGERLPLARQLLGALGFGRPGNETNKRKVFLGFVLPLLQSLLARREMDSALSLENLVYENYVKGTESEAHFAWCMERIAPLFTESGRSWRAELPALPQPPLEPPYRVGFFLHSASTLAHVEVLLNTLKGYRKLDEQPFEPTVYCFSGKAPEMEAALTACGVRLVMLNERFPETGSSVWQRLLRFRELLAEEGIQELVWISMVTRLALAFSLRMAPVQTWFAMKYRNFSHPEIDGYVTGSALTHFGTIGGRRWRTAMLGVDDWYDPGVESEAVEIRRSLNADMVLMTLARTEKMRDPRYLTAVGEILRAHPGALFLWAGRDEDPRVVEALRAAGVLERTRYIGWVNTRLFAQVADVFLDTFPFPCGFTLFQAMAAGKPVVIYDSPEAAQTGLWNFIKPLVEDGEGTAEERAELLSYMGDAATPLIPVARNPQDYVRAAGRFIEDADARARGGQAAKGFMARYFSDPKLMGSSLAQHFVELIEERRARQTA